MALPSSPAARHRAVAGTFEDRVRGVTDWDAPSPVAGWTARDVVAHLVDWFPGFLEAGAGIVLPPADAAADPVGAWDARRRAVQDVLDDPRTDGAVLADPHVGEVPLAVAIDRFYTTDVFLHTWDLARASAQDDRLDPEQCAEILAGSEPVEELMRSSGQYGPRVEVPAGASPQDRLLGFIGRDPAWSPPA
ncbi:TIGR03086 family metal-binding protein [Nocardioides euryhalodurans]|uniref:TIGR03086 family protein n=1 Tax=Nocardioides euryhalodurans TaxID=2518370 RepID=A0A4P7GNM8_9ACTN|nr:TIGR03086 family metal-binding protein [Nocardioides euryhalodurans]QBR93559.1 TIGR03086 family protein [Nocardioides euryhalodurans]